MHEPVSTHTRGSGQRNVAARMARWSVGHRGIAVVGWLVFAVAGVALAATVGTTPLTEAEMGTGESGRADRIVDESGFPDQAGEMVLVHSERHTASDPRFQAVVRDTVAAIEDTGVAENLRSPLEGGGEGAISADGHAALIRFDVVGEAETAGDRVQPALEAVERVGAAHSGFRVEQAGEASADLMIGETLDADLQRISTLSVPVTLGILLVAFGALLAAVLPVGLALTALFGALGLVAVVSQAVHAADITAHVMLLIGLAVGVDYCLFYIRREREERAAGRGPERALDVAAATSGRSVLISGLTVVIALAGMFLAGDATFTAMAYATILVVATAVLGSVTVLPALLSLLGDRVDLGRIPGLYRRGGGGRAWGVVLRPVLRWPAASALVAGAALVALALPVTRMHTADPGLEDLPEDLPIVATLDRIQGAFPGGPEPAQVVVRADDVTGPEMETAVAEFERRAEETGQLHPPFAVEVSPDRSVAVISVGLAGAGTDSASEEALGVLRGEVVPSTLGAVEGAEVAVTGLTAWSHDFNQQMRERLPIVFVFVLGLAFVLLLLSFRSVVIAGTAIVLNLLSVAAAYGLVVLIFQDGRFEGLLDYRSTGGIVNWLPMFLFVILFGLSMDYHVFILSRIREAHDRGLATRAAVAHGIRSTAGVVTSAAAVMVAVFSIFATMSLTTAKEMGVGLAAAVLIDATVVRALLLPSVMALLGEWNWYLPRWLGWLPRLSHGDEAPPAGRVHEQPLAEVR